MNLNPSASLKQALRSTALTSVAIAILFVGGFSAWSTYAPLASAAIAQGIVNPDSSRKTVQHLEGGIVQEILVHEGDHVGLGDVLMRLAPTQAQATFSARKRQWLRFEAERLRLQALEQRQEDLTWPVAVRAVDEPEFRAFLDSQAALFRLQRQTLQEKKGMLERRVGQLRQEIAAVQRENDGTAQQLDIIAEEIGDKGQLLEQGLLRKPELLVLQRLRAELHARIAANEAAIARSEQSIEEISIAIISAETDFYNVIAQDVVRVNRELAQLEEEIASSKDMVTRTEILAPVAGTILNLRPKTTGGVIRPGDPILDIVPEEDALFIEARLQPNDIDVVAVGQRARIHLSPYSARNLPPLTGTVARISPDVFTDEVTRQSFYQVRVQVDTEMLNKLPVPVMLKPGMQAEIFIMSAEQTLLSYLSAPIARSFRRAFREE